ncbi:copper resistance protein B [Altererythrobacter xixiisoli]|uniref:Copper resistance protein B n=1 Tax=Croceibacterium xixiisoli TaxID=1476466 RepID=A0A6I4TU66_9SPHN|nr:copper resistance protein B [Croceibacterium xixiisoli]MXO99586.1 copper resistance protein B [Croceibacterium xixiisoli]
MRRLLCLSALPLIVLAQPALGQAGDAHAGHRMTPPEAEEATPQDHSGHAMDHSTMDHGEMDHGQMDHGEMDHSQMDHSGMDHSSMGHAAAPPNPPVAPPPPGAFAGPQYAADADFDPAQMQRARDVLRREHGGMAMGVVMIDRLEAQLRKGREGYSFEADAWFGGDIDRLWIKANGEGAFGGQLDSVELQALWSHAIGPWFNLQAGARQDLRSGPERTHAVVAINGLAPYFFEVEGALFLSTQGELTAHAEAEYDQRLTQRLILQPAVGLKLSAQAIPELGLGSGVTSAEAGLRLRYEFQREFAPYVGVQYEHSFGETARLRRAAGDGDRGWSFLIGLRAWF